MKRIEAGNDGAVLLYVMMLLSVLGIIAYISNSVATSDMKNAARYSLLASRDDVANLIEAKINCQQTKRHQGACHTGEPITFLGIDGQPILEKPETGRLLVKNSRGSTSYHICGRCPKPTETEYFVGVSLRSESSNCDSPTWHRLFSDTKPMRCHP